MTVDEQTGKRSIDRDELIKMIRDNYDDKELIELDDSSIGHIFVTLQFERPNHEIQIAMEG